MATPTTELIRALRATAARLDAGTEYQWGHMGACNCGHLAQTITHLPRRQIHEWALERVGDWEQQANAYCPTSGYRIDDVITAMLDMGMTRGDIRQLERLSDPEVLARLPGGHRHLERNRRDHVVVYMRTWADLLADALADEAPVAVDAAA
jgi:hypothetical protein